MPNTAVERLHIAVAIIVGRDGRLLLARRPEASHLGGLWEFPGGKLEAGENALQALQRELLEELGIVAIPGAFHRCQQLSHDYTDRHILLDAWWLTEYEGEPFGREGQAVAWVAQADLAQYSFPQANQSLLAVIGATNLNNLRPDPLT